MTIESRLDLAEEYCDALVIAGKDKAPEGWIAAKNVLTLFKTTEEKALGLVVSQMRTSIKILMFSDKDTSNIFLSPRAPFK